MGIFYLSFGRRLSRLVFWGLFLVLSFPGFSFDSQEDPLYKQVNRNEWIRKADSIFIYKDDYKGAEKLYLEALRRLDHSHEELRTYSMIKLGNVYTSLNEYGKAEDLFRKVNQRLSRINDPAQLLLAEYYLYYEKYLNRIGQNIDSALFYADRSIIIRRNYLRISHTHDDSLRLAESLFFKAEIYKDQNIQTEAENLYREVENIYENSLESEDILMGRLYSSISASLREQFDFKNALDYQERAVQIFRSDSLNNLNRLTSAIIMYSNIYLQMEDYKSSIPISKEALKIIVNNEGLDRFLFYAYYNLSKAFIFTNQFELAEIFIDKTAHVVEERYPSNILFKAYLISLSGEYYSQVNDIQNAKKYLLRTDNIFKNQLNNDPDWRSYCYELIGDTYYRSNIPDSALYNYQYALNIMLDNFGDKNIYSNPLSNDDPNKRQVLDILYKKARAWKAFYDMKGNPLYLKEALSIYNIIDNMNDQARNSKLKDASLLILSDFYHDGYEMAIDCAWELYRQTQNIQYLEQGFQLMEKSKSMLLFKSLVQAERSRSINLPYSIKQREDSLRMLNVEFEQKIGQENKKESPDPDVLKDLESEKFQVVREIENLRSEISEKFPSYYQIRYDSLTKSLLDFQRYSNDHDLTGIEYFWGNQAIYVVATNGSGTDFIRIHRSEESDRAFRALLFQLSHGTQLDQLENDYRNYIRDAYLGYQYLIGGLDPEILKNKKLLIIPDGNLAQLPFEALLVQPGDSSAVDYRNLHYLILDKSVSYSYSFNFLQTHQSPGRIKKNDHNLLAFSYSNIDDFSEDNLRAADDFELFYSSQELKAIRKVIPENSRFFYGEEATEHQFKKLAPEYELIHLAVHGFADTLNGDNSKLIFKKGQDTQDDSILYMHELYGLDLSKADLAVLSACESGIGEEFRGEGVFSMARGFFYAGCPSIIMSLWRVSDKYSAQLMGDFYQSLKKGKKASSALRQSKLDFIKKQDKYNTHPVNWASFVYLGEEFQYKGQSINFLLISLILIVVASGTYFLIRSRRSYF